MVECLAKSGFLILESLSAKKCDLQHHATGIVTEAGELLDAITNHIINGKGIDVENIIEELGDLEFYLAGAKMNLSMEVDDNDYIHQPIINAAISISIKAAEFMDSVKKYIYYEKALDMDRIGYELGCIHAQMTIVRNYINVTHDQTIEHNMQKLAKRYAGYKYSNQAAHDRADKADGQ